MPVLSKHLFFQLSRILIFSILLLGLTQELFALPLKTTILNPEKQVVGQALVYIDYVELLKLDGTPLGRAGLPTQNLKCFSCFWKHLLVSLPHHLLWATTTNSSQSDNPQPATNILVKYTEWLFVLPGPFEDERTARIWVASAFFDLH